MSCLLNLHSEGRQGTSVVSGNRMVPAGVSHVCLQRLLSHAVREHVVFSALTVHLIQLITPEEFIRDKAATHLNLDLLSCEITSLVKVHSRSKLFEPFTVVQSEMKTTAAPMWPTLALNSRICYEPHIVHASNFSVSGAFPDSGGSCYCFCPFCSYWVSL